MVHVPSVTSFEGYTSEVQVGNSTGLPFFIASAQLEQTNRGLAIEDDSEIRCCERDARSAWEPKIKSNKMWEKQVTNAKHSSHDKELVISLSKSFHTNYSVWKRPLEASRQDQLS